jgi:hypothetical protein
VNREAWLNACLTELRSDFDRMGFPLPREIRVTCGWPSKSALAKKKRRTGECWSSDCSKDRHFEIFISPCISGSVEVLAILVHEAVHAAVGLECKHKGPFKTCALATGLEGKMTETNASEGLKVRLQSIVEGVGEYPHAAVDQVATSNAPPNQTCRQLKVVCDSCDCIIRMSQKAIDHPGTPTCACGGVMVPEGQQAEKVEDFDSAEG